MFLQGKTALITGSTSGIGLGYARALAAEGANVMINGFGDADAIQGYVAELAAASGGKALHSGADMMKPDEIRAMVAECSEKLGSPDILINNAGISMRALFQDLDLEVFRKVMDTNFWGTVYATKYCLPAILAAKGSIIGISSINGYRGTPARTAYTASKYAMNGFFESLRTEVMKKGVHVLVVAPGFTSSNIRNTALTADGSSQGESPRDESKMMSSEEVATHILQATSKRKRDLVLTTQGKLAVFLNKWIPGILDGIVYKQMAKEKDSPFQ